VDFPKWHDVGEVLLREKEKFPNEFQEPSKIFNEKDTNDALKNSKFCYSHVDGLIKSLNENSKKEKIGKSK